MEGKLIGGVFTKEAIPVLKERKKTDYQGGSQRFPSVLFSQTTHIKRPSLTLYGLSPALFIHSTYTADTICLSTVVCIPN